MAGPYKTVLTFSCETGQGWTETWYQTGQSSLTAAGAQAEALSSWRCQLCGQGSTLDTWTVLDVTTPRLSLSRDKLLGPLVSYPAVTDNPVSSQLGLVTCVPQSGRRQFWCRGIPDSWVIFDPFAGAYTLVGVFKTAFENFAAFITNGNWALRTVKSRLASVLKSQVTQVLPQPLTGFATLTLAAGGTFPGGVPAVVGGFRYPLQHLNGTFLFPNGYEYAAPTFTYATRFVTAYQATSYQAGAYVRQQEPQYNAITQCAFDRPGDRKVGKRLSLPRGRRSSR